MSTILFDKIVFGPVHSRRLGVSLGINLLPVDGKVCSFDCIYCECGLNRDGRTGSKLPTRECVKKELEETLLSMLATGKAPDVITFAGNGEPTLHPDFGGIIDDTICLRNKFFPKAKIAVLSNATMLHKREVFNALLQVDDAILKLDSISDRRIRQINAPNSPSFCSKELVEQLSRFNGKAIIQTMFLKGNLQGESVDNTTNEEIKGWIDALKVIQPRQVMIYTIDRETPDQDLQKATHEELDRIVALLTKEGLSASASY